VWMAPPQERTLMVISAENDLLKEDSYGQAW
jgi:hypothetical protein